MNIVVIDGQGGRMGRMLVEQIRASFPDQYILAIGTNSIATSVMLKAGATEGATGENPVIVAAADADIIVGPIGIIIADSLLGEITPAMANAVGRSNAQKVLLPVSRCKHILVGMQNLSMGDYLQLAVREIRNMLQAES